MPTIKSPFTGDRAVLDATPLGEDQPKKLIGYIARSTAPIEFEATVDDSPSGDIHVGSKKEVLTQGELVQKLADHFRQNKGGHLILQIHGFNNPQDAAEERYREAFQALCDGEIGEATAYVGYRWPSERLGAPKLGIGLTPILLLASLLLLSVILVALGGVAFLLHGAAHITWLSAVAWICGVLGGLAAISTVKIGSWAPIAALFLVPIIALLWPIALVLILLLAGLRFIVYYRDQYRATQYGAVDLITLVRELDFALTKPGVEWDERWRVKLTVVSHSMGSFVASNVIRILTDVFDPETVPSKTPSPEDLHKIGHAFTLETLIMVSPDLPTEMVLSGRANFVASAIHRFKHRFLFTNEGDEVVGLIANAAHFFALPNHTRKFAARLANLCLDRSKGNYGYSDTQWKSGVWTGISDLEDIDATIPPFVSCFTLVDCTDALDRLTIRRRMGKQNLIERLPAPTPLKRVLSPKVRGFGLLKNGHFNWLGHYLTLFTYIRLYDFHSGYFDADYVRSLIFSAAANGHKWEPIEKDLKEHQIAVLKSFPEDA